MSETGQLFELQKPPKEKKTKITPLMRQYFGVKSKYPDAILLFRVGDFYETFGEDAIKVTNILNIVLTSRNNGGSNIELAGFPHHSLDAYLPRLVKAGFRVAICDQLEKPSKEKKIVKRGVTEVVTPGLTLDDSILASQENNFLVSVFRHSKDNVGIAFLDISTGEFVVSEGSQLDAEKLLEGFKSTEVVYPKKDKDFIESVIGSAFYTFAMEDWIYTYDFARERLLDHFGTNTLKGFGVEEMKISQVAAGAILHYLQSNENHNHGHILRIQPLDNKDYVWLDRFTLINLELLKPAHPSGLALVDVLDLCFSPMGSRLMRQWISMPLIQKTKIEERQSAVMSLLGQQDFKNWGQLINQVGDLERLVSKVASNKTQPRDFLILLRSLTMIPELKKRLAVMDPAYLLRLGDMLHECTELKQKIEREVREDAPSTLSKGNVFKEGCSDELNEYRHLIKNSKEILVNLQRKEASETGIDNLKVGYNNVFGYYLEVTNKYKNQGLIPEHWVRKQTLKGSERYITDELKIIEEKILSAEGKIAEIEEELYTRLLTFTQDYIEPLQINAKVIATLDCLLSFARVAADQNYCLPSLHDGDSIVIKNGRHPVIEQQMPPGETYIPNDLFLDEKDQQILLITGPNMSGKSAILRQTALICLMAQMGCYVPADEATLGIVDKVFTRVGASDNLSKGESTFMVEMNETAGILNNVSSKSLILLDEIGRGTSTYDGISLAWSIAEYLHDHKDYRPKTLFATHYHELSQLEESFERIKNFHVQVKELNEEVVFLRKLIPGAGGRSFGIHVARMAGIPKEVLLRAQQILVELETKHIDMSHDNKAVLQSLPPSSMQLQIFDHQEPLLQEMKEEISRVDINALTPMEALLMLQKWKTQIGTKKTTE